MSRTENKDQLRQSLIGYLSKQHFCSGEYLAQELSLSRTAISKHIAALRRSGFKIDAVRGKGYHLASSFEVLDQALITSLVAERSEIEPDSIELFASIPSTNDYLLQQASLPSQRVVIAEEQTAGRGRQGRRWLSSAGNITLSLSWRFQRAQAAMSGLTLAVAIAVIRAIEAQDEQCKDKIKVKWPNDVLFDGAKLAGILVELRGEAMGPVDVVMGVGVNISLPSEWQQRIEQRATDMSALIEKPISRNQFAADLIVELQRCCKEFAEHGFGPFRRQWRQRDLYHNKPVTLRIAETLHRGISEGVDDNGALLLRYGNTLKAFHSGEIERSRFEL